MKDAPDSVKVLEVHGAGMIDMWSLSHTLLHFRRSRAVCGSLLRAVHDSRAPQHGLFDGNKAIRRVIEKVHRSKSTNLDR